MAEPGFDHRTQIWSQLRKDWPMFTIILFCISLKMSLDEKVYYWFESKSAVKKRKAWGECSPGTIPEGRGSARMHLIDVTTLQPLRRHHPCSEERDQIAASSRKRWRRKAGRRNPSQSIQLSGLWSAVDFRESSALILALLTEFLYLPSWLMPALAIIILISLLNRNSSCQWSFLTR